MCLPFLILRIFRRAFLLVVVLAVIYLGATLFQVFKVSIMSKPVHSQAIVVMGSAEYDGLPSRDLSARLQKADLLYKEQYAPMIYLTGGSIPGDKFSEAGAGKTYLESKGVPGSAIIANPIGRDSWESVVSVSKLLRAHSVSSVIVVSDGFHLLRSTQMFGSLGFKTSASPAINSPVKGTQLLIDYGRETVAVAASRIVGYKFLSVLRHGS